LRKLLIAHVHLYKFHTSLLHQPKKALDFIFSHNGNDFSSKANANPNQRQHYGGCKTKYQITNINNCFFRIYLKFSFYAI
jgi:hypothetical protein